MPPSPRASLASWYRVAAGLRLILNAAGTRTTTVAGTAAARWAEHGADVAASARTAAAAAGSNLPATAATGAPLAAANGGSSSASTKQQQHVPTSSSYYSAGASDIGDAGEFASRTAAGTAATNDSSNGEEAVRNAAAAAAAAAQPSAAREGGGVYEHVQDDGPMGKPQMGRGGGTAEGAPDPTPAESSSRLVEGSLVAPATADGDDSIRGDATTTDATATIPTHSDHDDTRHHQYDDQYPTAPTLKEGPPVPSTRLGRAAGFASLGIGLAAGTAAEAASRLLRSAGGALSGGSSSSVADSSDSAVPAPAQEQQHSSVASDANADRLAAHLCRMRGAALKLGQMLSMQDEKLLPPPLARALERVRGSADAMPGYQLEAVLGEELGAGWRERLDGFEDLPFAAASIGQVHRAVLSGAAAAAGDDDERVGGGNEGGRKRRVAMKVQYPGVADSIDSDLNNLSMLVKATGMAPPGLFIDEVIRVGRDELKVECDYLREANNQARFRDLVLSDPVLSGPECRLSVPRVIPELTTGRVLTTELAPGGTVDKVSNLDQEERNRIGRAVLRLTMRELFAWRFMQTDPNWGNFLYDVGTGTTHLIDFGAARDYDKSFVDGYLRIVKSSADHDVDTLMDVSHRMGFLTGEENAIMLEAHKMSGFTVGEPFATDEPYDFGRSGISARLSGHSSAFLQHRLTPPPEEVYTLHRKLAGAYNLCIKVGAIIRCRDLLDEVVEGYVYTDG